MKISNLYIHNYRQFKEFELDLTYPVGHKHEGKPLDKVCFIGRNGTGKSTLLSLIKEFVIRNNNKYQPLSLIENIPFFFIKSTNWK